jgi:hypothetical protein
MAGSRGLHSTATSVDIVVAVLGLAVKDTTTVNLYVFPPTKEPASIFSAALLEVSWKPGLLSARVLAELPESSFVQSTDQEYESAFSVEHDAAWNINKNAIDKYLFIFYFFFTNLVINDMLTLQSLLLHLQGP